MNCRFGFYNTHAVFRFKLSDRALTPLVPWVSCAVAQRWEAAWPPPATSHEASAPKELHPT